jgi:hypothetical protein
MRYSARVAEAGDALTGIADQMKTVASVAVVAGIQERSNMAKNTMSKGEKPKFARNRFSREEKDRKRAEAEARQASYDSMTAEQKIAKLDACGFAAVKERLKIWAGKQAKAIADDVEKTVLNELVEHAKEKRGTKARKQAKKDKKAS